MNWDANFIPWVKLHDNHTIIALIEHDALYRREKAEQNPQELSCTSWGGNMGLKVMPWGCGAIALPLHYSADGRMKYSEGPRWVKLREKSTRLKWIVLPHLTLSGKVSQTGKSQWSMGASAHKEAKVFLLSGTAFGQRVHIRVTTEGLWKLRSCLEPHLLSTMPHIGERWQETKKRLGTT